MLHFLAAIPGLGPISQFFATVLKVFDSFTGNFGLSIILLTVAFRIVTLPLSIKQTKSMIAMQRLQPQLKEIQKKYKDDREKQGQEMMKLYKENKVSPLGGCLPLLIQLPILFALFDVLHNTAKYVHWQTNYGFMGIQSILATGSLMWSGGKMKFYDVSKGAVTTIKYPGGEYVQVVILILLTIATGYVSAKMMSTDPRQSKLMALMPVVMGVFAWILPAGVTIYIIVTNVLTIAQQYVQLEREGFYEERLAQKEKTGEPIKGIERLKNRFIDMTSTALIAIKIKPPPERKKKPTAKKKPVSKKGKTAGAEKPADHKAGAPAGKKQPQGAQKKKKVGVEEQQGKKTPTRRPDEEKHRNKPKEKMPERDYKKDYPAKKKGGKK